MMEVKMMEIKMKTQWTSRAGLCTFAIASLALASAGTPAQADGQTDNRPVMALNGWNGVMGPGLGSTKTPFGVVEVGTPVSGAADDALYFHTSTGQPAQQAPATHMGPGPWSSKSPFSGLYANGSF